MLYFKDSVAMWTRIMQHETLDEFWKPLLIWPHLKNIKPAVMTVGGWFDQEDMLGPLSTYKHIEKNKLLILDNQVREWSEEIAWFMSRRTRQPALLKDDFSSGFILMSALAMPSFTALGLGADPAAVLPCVRNAGGTGGEPLRPMLSGGAPISFASQIIISFCATSIILCTVGSRGLLISLVTQSRAGSFNLTFI
jgi:hypothetical protein